MNPLDLFRFKCGGARTPGSLTAAAVRPSDSPQTADSRVLAPPLHAQLRTEAYSRPLGKICSRLGGCIVDLSDGWCSTCEAFLDPPKERCAQ